MVETVVAETARAVEAADSAGSVRRRQGLRRSGRLPDIDTRRCTGCGRCVAGCDLHLLSLEAVRWEKFAVLHEPDRCSGCSECVAKCPFDAITMRRQSAAVAFTGGDAPMTQSE